ncbi:unnamed protein product [Pedinophyceae sp. YPF-701]|nr:unnamed protein product [Pedinophyceae sp. YPF-701]
MAAAERAGWMDNQASEALRETIEKEKKITQEHMRRQQEAGKVPATPELEARLATATASLSPKKNLGGDVLAKEPEIPAALRTLKENPELGVMSELSVSMWKGCNSAYCFRDPAEMRSVAKDDYKWDEEEIAFMKEEGLLDKTHNRRRDKFTQYVEAAAIHNKMMKQSQS